MIRVLAAIAIYIPWASLGRVLARRGPAGATPPSSGRPSGEFLYRVLTLSGFVLLLAPMIEPDAAYECELAGPAGTDSGFHRWRLAGRWSGWHGRFSLRAGGRAFISDGCGPER